MIKESSDFVEARVDHTLLRQMHLVLSSLRTVVQTASSVTTETTNHTVAGSNESPPSDKGTNGVSIQEQHDALQAQVSNIEKTVQSISHDVKAFIKHQKTTTTNTKSYANVTSTVAPKTKEKAFANRWTVTLNQEMRDKVKADGFKTTMALIRTALNTTAFPSDPPKIEGLAQLRSGDLAIWFASYEDKAKAIAKRSIWMPDWSASIVPPRNQQKHGVLLSYVPTKLNPDSIAMELQARYPLGYVSTCRWLTATGSKKVHSTLVVHTMNKTGAEELHGKRVLTIQDQVFKIVDYYKTETRTSQCFNCQGYGHLSYQCTQDTRCAKCAGSHRTAACELFPRGDPLTENLDLLQCINCDAQAPSWHSDCPKATLKNYHHSDDDKRSEYDIDEQDAADQAADDAAEEEDAADREETVEQNAAPAPPQEEVAVEESLQ
jgi:hypothetical protein